MSSFTTPLVCEDSEDESYRKVIISFTYQRGRLGSGVLLIVPKGFITDGASIPQIFWNILSPWGNYAKAAVLHDWLYAKQDMTKLECDNIFLEAMEALGVNWFKRNLMFTMVRWFAGPAWLEHQKRGDPEKIAAGGLPEFPDVKFLPIPEGG